MRAARVRGGRGKSRTARVAKLMPSAMRPIFALLLDAIQETRNGVMDPRIATAVAALAGAAVRVYQSASVEEQIAALETQIAALSRRSG